MSDPVLDAHQQEELYYLISGPSPISIRDQMLRGLTLVERLIEAREIGPVRPLLVVGGGAAGATAAIEAASRGIATVLIEAHQTPFLTHLRRFDRRRLDRRTASFEASLREAPQDEEFP